MSKGPAGVVFLLAIALLGAGCSRAASDQKIAANVRTRMSADLQLKGSSLSVAVKNGVATLTGRVPSVAARYEAFKLTADTAGVKNVDDQMTVEEPMANTETAAAPAPPAPESKSETHAARLHRAIPSAGPAANQSASSQMPAEVPAPDTESGTEPEPAPAVPAPAPNLNAAPAPPLPASAERITIPQGTRIEVRMIDAVNSAVNHTGDILHASLAKPIKVDKQIVAPAGSDVYLELVEDRSAGHFGGQSELRLELYRIVIQGTSYPVVSNDYVDKGASRTKRSVLTILGGGAIGAAIGAIAGGGKGSAIGAAAGAGGGAVYQGATNGKQVGIAPETLLKFKLAQPASLVLNPISTQPNPQP